MSTPVHPDSCMVVSVVDPSNSGGRRSRRQKSEAKTVLQHEELDVYQVSIQFVAVAVAVAL